MANGCAVCAGWAFGVCVHCGTIHLGVPSRYSVREDAEETKSPLETALDALSDEAYQRLSVVRNMDLGVRDGRHLMNGDAREEGKL